MARPVSPAVALAASQPNITFVYLVEFEFADANGIVSRERATNAPFDITWAGNEYYGFGRVLEIDSVKETSDLAATGMSFTLSGIPVGFYQSIALGQFYQGRPCLLRIAMLDDDHQILNDPILLFSGRMDTMNLVVGDSITVKINAESVMAAWDRSKNTRFNHQVQTSIAGRSNDLFFNHAENMINKNIIWGRA